MQSVKAYPAMLWITVCFALLGSYQFGKLFFILENVADTTSAPR